MTVIAVVNSKGGVGKSTTSINLAQAFLEDGYKTLLVDHDPRRGTATRWRKTADKTSEDGLPVVKIETGIVKLVADFKRVYDIVVVDGPAYMDNANTALIACADIVLIPVQPSQADIWGTEEVLNWIEERQMITGGTPEARFLLSQCHADERVSRAETEEIASYGIPVMKEKLINRVNYSRALRDGITVFSFPKSDKARKEVEAVYKELKHDCSSLFQR